jgi:hypothetical protein
MTCSPTAIARHRARVSGALAALTALALVTSPALGAGGWSKPRPLADDAGTAFAGRPAAAFRNGVLYVAAAAGAPQRGIRLFTIDAGGTTVRHVTHGRDRQPAIAVSASGVIHLVFSRRGGGCDARPCTIGILYARSVDGGGSWSVERVHAGDHDVHPSISLDPEGKPWVYFRSRNRIVERHRVQGAWSGFSVDYGCCGTDRFAGPEVKVVGGQQSLATRLPRARRASPAGFSEYARLAVYRVNTGGGRLVMTLTQSDFSVPFLITEADDAFDPNLAIDASLDVHVVYRRAGDGLWHARLTRQGAFVRTRIAAAETRGEPAIAALRGGRILVVAAAASGLIYRTNASGSWTGGSILGTGGGPGEPALATLPSGGSRVVVRKDADPGRLWLTRHPPHS